MKRLLIYIFAFSATIIVHAYPQDLYEALQALDTEISAKKSTPTQSYRFDYVRDMPTDSLDTDEVNALLRSAHHNHAIGADAIAVAAWSDALEQLTPSDLRFSYISRCIADYYAKYASKEDEQLYYLCLSALGDVTNNIEHSSALAKAGRILLKRNDYQRAKAYIMYSAATRDTDSNIAEDMDLLVAMDNLFDESQQSHKRHHIIFFSIAILLIAMLIILAIAYYRQQNRNKLIDNTLDNYRTNNEAQETVIKQLLSLCELMIESNDDFVRLTGRKIKTGQVQDLYKSIEAGKPQSDRIDHFTTAFDEIFYKIFPYFKAQVNDLFQPDKRIELTEGVQLTAEQRILAFMRLGIDEPAKLNKFLGLSINTIYTYRNKAKSRAMNRDNFEDCIKKIGIKH